MLQLLRYLLFPFSLLYGLVISIRNLLYDTGILKSKTFAIPLISVGNLVVGGTGKSPMTEYLIRILKEQARIAVLSRGYGRKTSGYRVVDMQASADDSGDEPVQIKHKFPGITVAVCEDRATGIDHLEPDHDVILLDDAFQHRSVSPGLSILLYDYASVFKRQFLLPSGNLREPLNGRKRADIIVVTKTPENLPPDEQKQITEKIKPFPGQELFFSWLSYGNLIPLNGGPEIPPDSLSASEELVLLTGIANPKPLLSRLEQVTATINHLSFPDHHTFSRKNILKLASIGAGKTIITTEKDAQRLKLRNLAPLIKDLRIYYLPVEANMHPAGEERFRQIIGNYVATKHT